MAAFFRHFCSHCNAPIVSFCLLLLYSLFLLAVYTIVLAIFLHVLLAIFLLFLLAIFSLFFVSNLRELQLQSLRLLLRLYLPFLAVFVSCLVVFSGPFFLSSFHSCCFHGSTSFYFHSLNIIFLALSFQSIINI